MSTKKLEVELPEEILSYLGEDSLKRKTKVLEIVVLDLVRRGEITTSYAAQVLDMQWQSLLDLMVEYKIPLVNYPGEEVREELSVLREFTK